VICALAELCDRVIMHANCDIRGRQQKGGISAAQLVNTTAKPASAFLVLSALLSMYDTCVERHISLQTRRLLASHFSPFSLFASIQIKAL